MAIEAVEPFWRMNRCVQRDLILAPRRHCDTHELGGYFASMDGTLKILGKEIVWDVEAKAEEAETPKVVVN
jgi:hypothetical protein